MKIGHSPNESQTFRPEFVPNDQLKMMFIDVAGFDDTGGMLIELINNFVIKQIYNNAKSVRFLFAITHNEIVSTKGQKLREFINLLDMMCRSEISSIKESVIPILTKCKPGDDEIDLDDVRNTIGETVEEEFKTLTQYCTDQKIKEAII